MKCRCCGKPGTETCSDCYGTPFERKESHMDLGTLRILSLRTMQIVFYVSGFVAYGIAFLGIPESWWTVMIPIASGSIYCIFDYKYILPQEQKFMFDKNPGFKALEKKIDELSNRIGQKAD